MKRIAILAVALAGVALFALTATALAQGPLGGNPPYGGGWMGGGMMRGYGYGFSPNQAITPTVPYGPGPMMRGWGPGQGITPTLPYRYGPGGMMGGFGRGGMMGGYGYGYAPGAPAITLDQAVTKAQEYLAAYNSADLKLVEVEEYSQNFYGVVQEKSTGINAFQVIVDKYSGAVYPEMGPNMMWNTKYSPMGWMAGGPGFNQPSDKMTVTMDQARTNAEQYLKTYLPNTTVEDKGDTFYGYYNFDVLQNGKTFGMLSVNGYTGAVWYHTWHGAYIATKSLE